MSHTSDTDFPDVSEQRLKFGCPKPEPVQVSLDLDDGVQLPLLGGGVREGEPTNEGPGT
jgi:hypothetical protein